MASSKSFGASVLPSSLSLSSLRSNSEPEKPPRESPRRASTFDPFKQHRRRHHPQFHRPQTLHQDPIALSSKGDLEEKPAPSPVRLRSKSRTWSARVSSFFPQHISQPADPPIPRKIDAHPPSATTSIEPSSPPPPPPPYNPHESTASLPNDESRQGQNLDAGSARAPPPPELGLHPSPRAVSMPLLDMAGFPLTSPGSPLIMMPTPPSPESRSATSATQELTVQTVSRRGSASDNNEEASKQARIQKEARESRRRSKSLHQQPSALPALATSPPTPVPRGRLSSSTQAPSIASGDASVARITPPPVNPRPRSAKDRSQSPSVGRFRRSWLPGGGRSRSSSADARSGSKAFAWILSDDATQAEYNYSFLKNGEKVPELWNENCTVYVYLYPKRSGCAPSFKVPEFTVSSSYVFNELMQSELEAPGTAVGHVRSFSGRHSLGVDDAAPASSPPPGSPGCMHLYLPATPPPTSGQLKAAGQGLDVEVDRLIAIRNMFAFLTGQPLVGTKSRPTIFQVFLKISELLQEYGFSGIGEDTFGEAVDLSFGFYSDQLGLADCRHSREKTLEALILAERMRSLELYNEAFAHAVGKYSAIKDLRLPLFEQVSPHTRQRLERAHLDLVNREHNVNQHLEQFDFPSLFAGIANSTSFTELRHVRFRVWRSSFNRMRHFILSHYKATFGNWPPKARSKKNPFAESGLNRLVLKVLYSDMCALYDLLVDRTSLTSRVIDEVPAISGAPDQKTTSALRNIMSEFDRSKPPVLPPVPYDLPQLPSMTAIHETFKSLSPKHQSRFEKGIKEHELCLILNKAYNYDIGGIKLPILDKFKDFEMREARGKMCQDLVDQRFGYWLCLYVILQSLPMLVVDAPGLKFTEGVEYFLCEPPMGNPPWVEDRQVRKMWYEVTGGGGRLVELSADAVMFSVEATYHRSHCWLAASKWQGDEGADAPPPEEQAMSPLRPPRPVFQDDEPFASSPPPRAGTSTPSPPPGGPQPSLRSRTLSPGVDRASHAWRSSIAIGLEPVPMEPPSLPGRQSRSSSMGPRPLSSYMGSRSVSAGNLGALSENPEQSAANSGATFDDILGNTQKQSNAKKKSRFFYTSTS